MEIKTTLKILYNYELLDNKWNNSHLDSALKECQDYEDKQWIAVDDIVEIQKELEKQSKEEWNDYLNSDERQTQGYALGLDTAIEKLKSITKQKYDKVE